MSWTKLILAVYPALVIASLYLTGKGMADQLDLMPRPSEAFWMTAWSIWIPALHLFALRRIRFDTGAHSVVSPA